ncbi:SusC/RagA family TonB-linked outer membrane protein [Sphingobacterium sp. SRCM116780]|uniref:SusC/RagA family TonB-linked outer membrane protein n=1 Tax=Sphingobacterium sp. SRCM116780 TaxID=2907623 RepID=UPI001F3E8893|nr:SusC/RagA family TonB-linked outer membrane protein [Sphingobacterium sp. SRCM116780]UIR54896.1 SusC/RagA family TonB-linked outer membrane protein [Sphingobacterium sp. SRCM116780]
MKIKDCTFNTLGFGLNRGKRRMTNLAMVLMTGAFLQANASVFAQKVNFVKKNTTIGEVFQQIKKQTGYEVLYANQKLDFSKKLNADFVNVELNEVLNKCLTNLSVSYVIEDKVIVIKSKSKITINNKNQPISLQVSKIDVKGKILDPDGKPLGGASISVKGTKIGTKSNSEGDFSLPGVDSKGILLVSYIGYQPLEISPKIEIGTIKMQKASNILADVVIISTGYQNIAQSQNTGSVARVKAQDLVINGATTIEQMLQGKLAGVEVVNNSGMVGKRQTVRVRGTSTLLGNQEPVWVVDGIIQEDPLPFKASELNAFNQDPANADALKNFIGSAISWLNPYDIQDITVLKDAASTAIYGVKAANGVIVINTKRGVTGRAPSVSYSTSLSSQQGRTYDKMNLMNSKERVDVSREIWEKGLVSQFGLDDIGYSKILKEYLTEKLSYDEFNAKAKQLEVNNTDWFDLLFHQPFSHNHNVSISGGGTGSTYYGSLGYNNQQGEAKGNGMDSYLANLNFTSIISSKLTISTRLSGNYSNTSGYFRVDPYSYARNTSRVIPATLPDGSLSYYTLGGYRYNVLNELNNTGNENIKTNLNAAVNLRYELPYNLRFESTFGIAFTNAHAESYATELTNRISSLRGYEYGQFTPVSNEYKMSRLPIGGELATADDRNTNYTWRNAITYGKVFNHKHSISSMLGLELRSNVYKGMSNTVFGYLPERGKAISNPPATIINGGVNYPNSIYDPGAGDSFKFLVTDRTANYVSYYYSGSYSYDNRYIFSASLRGDASNRFGQDTKNRFNPIWALGGRWNVARENFFNKSTWFNDFSLRGSYGYQGNVAENYGPDLIARIPTGGGASVISPQTGEPILNIKSLPYANLRWEKTQTVNLGLDFGFFNNRVVASLDYYNKASKDLIVLKDIPYENGARQMPMNGGTLTNTGYEAQVSFFPIRKKDWNWGISVNSSKNISKVTNKLLPNPTWANAVSGNYFVDGYAVSSFWVFDYKGPNPETGLPEFNIPTTEENPDAKFNAASFMKYAGKLNADFTAGFNTSLRYKQLTVSTNLYASLGGHKLLAPLYTTDMVNNTPNEYNNLSKDLVDRWRKPGDEAFTNIPGLPYFGVPFVSIPSGSTSLQPGSSSPYTLYNYSTARLVNASYLRINNVNLSYTLPDYIARRIHTKSLTLGYTMSNLYTFVSKDFKDVDPEVASGGQPLPQTHVLNLSVTF